VDVPQKYEQVEEEEEEDDDEDKLKVSCDFEHCFNFIFIGPPQVVI
jgi:hypothetical protein